MKTIGPFEVLRQLGSGGMGAVYAVRHPHHPRPLALKLILPHVADATSLLRFQREAEVMARVRHPGVVVIHQVGQSAEGPFLVTELIEGRSLEEQVGTGPLDPQVAAQLTRALADAMVAVHAAGVVHRDLKPANVVLREDGSPVVLDFGIAQDESAEALTRTGTMLGSPHYMSPEQCDGDVRGTGPQSDVYGLGAILYTLLSGERPFGTETGVSLIRAVLLGALTPPRRLVSAVPPPLEAICVKAMATEPTERYASMQALRDDLDRFLAGQRVQAPLLRTGRSKLVPGAVGALVLAAAIGVALATGGDPTPPPPPPAAPSGPAPVGSSQLAELNRLPDWREFQRAHAALLAAHPDDARLAELLAARTELEELTQRLAKFTPERVEAFRTRYPALGVPRALRDRFLRTSLERGAPRVIGVHDAIRGRGVVVDEHALSLSPEGEWGVARWSLDGPSAHPLETLDRPLRLSVRQPFLERRGAPRLLFVGDPVHHEYQAVRLDPRALKASAQVTPLPLRGDETARDELRNEQAVIASSPDGSLIAVGFRSGRLDLFDASFKLLCSKKQAHEWSVNSLVFTSPTRLVSGGGSIPDDVGGTLKGHLKYWDLSDPKAPTELHVESFQGEAFVLESIASPQGEVHVVAGVHAIRQVILFACEPGLLRRVRLFLGATLKAATARDSIRKVELTSMDSPPYAAVVSPDRARLYVGGGFSSTARSGELRVWDVESGAEIAAKTGHHSENLNSLGLSPDGQRLISAATRTAGGRRQLTLEVWDVDLPASD